MAKSRKEISTKQMKIRHDTVRIVTLALLIALQVVLSRFLSINLQFLKIGFSFIPLMFAGYLYGASGGVIVAATSDLIGSLLFPSGPFFPGFTATAALAGFVYGLVLNGKGTTLKITVGVLAEQVICSLLLNSWWLSILYHSPFTVLLTTRIWQVLVMTFVEIVFAEIFFKRASFIHKLKSELTKYNKEKRTG